MPRVDGSPLTAARPATWRRRSGVAAEVDRLRLDVEAMLAVAARRGLIVPDERERLSLGVRRLPPTRRLHGELAAIVRPAGR